MLSRTKVQMGTFVSISLQADKKEFFKPAFGVIQGVDNSLSSYKKTASIYRLNHQKKVALEGYIFEALTLSCWYCEKTDGYFDIAMGSVTKDLYHFGEQEQIPSISALQRANLALEGLSFNTSNARIASDMTIDLGGMGKGFGVDKAVAFLKEQGVKKAVVAASGDIRCLSQCFIEINNPFSQKALAHFHTKSQEMGVSTSGNYNRYVQDTTHNHLINPKTKTSQQNFISVTLISTLPSSDLDAYATAVSVMPKEKAFKFLTSQGIAYIILDSNRKLFVSENINQVVDDLLLDDTSK